MTWVSHFANTAIMIIAIVGALAPLEKRAIEKLRVSTKSNNVKLALNFAELVVNSIGDASNRLRPEERTIAIDQLYQRLKQNGLAEHFTAEDMASYIDKVADYTTTPEKFTKNPLDTSAKLDMNPELFISQQEKEKEGL